MFGWYFHSTEAQQSG